jgi:hypothetical protein
MIILNFKVYFFEEFYGLKIPERKRKPEFSGFPAHFSIQPNQIKSFFLLYCEFMGRLGTSIKAFVQNVAQEGHNCTIRAF